MTDLKEKIRQLLAGRGVVHLQAGSTEPAAVLIPLFLKDGAYNVLFTKRTEKVANHKGQISFPGGRLHRRDSTPLVTALRETREEIGVKQEDVDVLGQLDDMITISNYLVRPFVGAIPFPYEFCTNKFEVDVILDIPLATLLDKSHSWCEVHYGFGYPNPSYFYEHQGNIVWGVTARILHQFLELIDNAHLV